MDAVAGEKFLEFGEGFGVIGGDGPALFAGDDDDRGLGRFLRGLVGTVGLVGDIRGFEWVGLEDFESIGADGGPDLLNAFEDAGTVGRCGEGSDALGGGR